MFSTSAPSRSRRATNKITPTSRVSVIKEPKASSGLSALAAIPADTRVVAVRLAIVEVVEVLMAREPPNSA